MALLLDELLDDFCLSNLNRNRDELKEFLSKCVIHYYDWGAIFHIGNSVHIHILTKYRKKVFLRKPLREVAFLLFKEYPVIVTTTQKYRGESVINFHKRIGWKVVGEDEVRWRLEMRKEDFKYANA